MRDDRYKGTSLPGAVRKLCRMAERAADRAHPERLRAQAVVAFVSDANKEISPEFRRQLHRHDAAPTFFGAGELKAVARSALEADVAAHIQAYSGADAIDAISDALRRRSEGYRREQKCRLVANRYPDTSLASAAVRKA